MSPPRVSVVVPVRDRATLLARCLDALDAQTWDDLEVVVADDGSRDGSGELAAGRTVAGRPVRVVLAGGHGAVRARTTAVGAARGEVLAFTDSDCCPEPGWVAALVAAVDAGAAGAQGVTLPEWPPGPRDRTVAVDRFDGLFATCNVAYRRDAFERAGGFDLDAGDRLGFRHGRALRGLGFGEDTLLGWRVRRAGEVAFCPDAVVRHAVFGPDLVDSLRRAWAAGGFPALVAEVPELGDVLLRRGRWLGGPERLWLLGALGAAALGARRPAAALAGAWAGTRARALARRTGSWPAALPALPAELAVDAVTAAALAVGSARARRLVL